MQQYYQIKASHPGALLLFRVGDFYETFAEDAAQLSRITGIVLTKRSNGSASEVALAGFPHHALDGYIARLVRAGCRIAICEQLEDPSQAKGLVRRGVTEVITPGLAYSDHVLDKRHNNYLASLHRGKQQLGLALLDLSTGEFILTEGPVPHIEKLVSSFSPAEMLFSKAEKREFCTLFPDSRYHLLPEWVYHHRHGYEKLNHHFGTTSLKGFGVEGLADGITAAGGILAYLKEARHQHLSHISSIARLDTSHYLWLDKFTIRNLELLQPQQEEGTALIDVLDHTVTPMGARMLRQWVLFPLRAMAPIQRRQKAVGHLVSQEKLRKELLRQLDQIGDLERLIAKVAARRISPRELLSLHRSLEQVTPIRQLLLTEGEATLQEVAGQLDPCQKLGQRIATTLQPDLPLVTNQGGLIQPGIDPQLDELRQMTYSAEDGLDQLLKKIQQESGISSLKIGMNKVHGYYFEVRHTHKDKVPASWHRRQTLVNAERYTTSDLEEYEQKIRSAQDRSIALEQHLFHQLVEEASMMVVPIQKNARLLAELDCYAGLAHLAALHGYVCPEVNEDRVLSLHQARHPVIEQRLPPGVPYIPNDIYLDDEQHILLITGPNMGGKSALLRKVEIQVIMAQMGSFVPAGGATVGLFDKLFSRVGASDNLAQGESTFMVEMNETASILHNLSDRSLVILDELGRGTSTQDGLPVAQSCLEYLHDHPRCRARVLFATHYHELAAAEQRLPRVKNFHMAVRQQGEQITFLYKLVPGSSPSSFGIEVARMAGMPPWVVLRAREIRAQLQAADQTDLASRLQQMPSALPQSCFLTPAIHPVVETLRSLRPDSLSPIEALLLVRDLCMTASKDENS